MIAKKIKNILFVFVLVTINCFSQNDLLDDLQETTPLDSSYSKSVFKDLKVVNFESTKLVAKKELTFIVAHRFGSLQNGIDTFFGLDDAVTRLNFVYGISDGFNVSVSRSSFQKIYEAAIKYRLLRQQNNGFPFTVVGYNSVQINTALDEANLPKLRFINRVGYTAQILVSRKINKNASLLIAPTLFHDNFVLLNTQSNTQFALGLGGRHKLTKRVSLNLDYGLHLNRASQSPFKNPLSIGFDIETGGHVFQLHFTNSQPMNTNAFLSQATGDWSEGDVFFGFNISRRF